MEEIFENSVLFAFGLNHKTSSVEVREKLYVHETELPLLLDKLKETLTECVIISTCNRTEIYGVSPSGEIDLAAHKNALIEFKNASGLVDHSHFFELIACAATRQLFDVVTSLDSKVIGDSQILGQIKRAYSIAKDNGSAGKILNQLFQRALALGKRTFTESALHKGAVSVSMAAVELAADIFGTVTGRSVLVIGAGDTAQNTAECLIKQKVGRITLTNRTRERAEDLAAELATGHGFKCDVIDFEGLREHLNQTDIVISSTSSDEPILYEEDFRLQTNKILLIDIAVPRDIDSAVTNNANVALRNIDDLHAVLDTNHKKRMSDVPVIKGQIMKEMGSFLMWYYSLPLMPQTAKGVKRPCPAAVSEIVEIKEFLNSNVSEFHKLAAGSGQDFQKDLIDHSALVRKLVNRRREMTKTPDAR